MLRKSENADRLEEDGNRIRAIRERVGWREIKGARRLCPPSEGASKGNFTKADPLVMNVI